MRVLCIGLFEERRVPALACEDPVDPVLDPGDPAFTCGDLLLGRRGLLFFGDFVILNS